MNEKGIKTAVASVPFISNLDHDYLKKASLKGPIITLEEHSRRGGFGGCLLEYLNKEKINCKVKIMAASQFNLSQIGSQDFLRESNGLSALAVVEEFIALREV